MRLDHDALCGAIGIGAQFHKFGLQRQFFEQIIKSGFLQRRNFHILNLAAHRLNDDLMLQQALTNTLRICAFFVHLVDRNDHRDASGLTMLNCFDRLRHQTVIGRDHKDDNIGNAGAALAHLRECFVARCVKERNYAAIFGLHLICANMLRNSAGFARHYIGSAQRIEQAGFTMIDMAHHRNNGRTRFQCCGIVLYAVIVMHNVNIGLRHADDVMAELFDQQFRCILVNGFGQGNRHTHFEQRFN